MEFEFTKEFQKISTKKITRRLINDYFYLKRFVYMSVIFIGIIIVASVFKPEESNKFFDNIISLIILFTITYFFMFYFRITNKEFLQLDAHSRQFYILFLMRDIIKSNDRKKKYKLWALIYRYKTEIVKIINQNRSQNIFIVNKQVKDIILLNNNINGKMIGNIIEDKFQDEIFLIIDRLLLITYLNNNEEFILDPDKFDIDISIIKKDVFDLFDNIEPLNSKIELFRINRIIQYYSRFNFDFMVVLILSVIVISSYVLISYYLTDTFDIGTLFEITLAAPAFILLIINQIKKR